MNDHSDIADSYHYQVIARALAEIDAAQAAGELLTLEAI